MSNIVELFNKKYIEALSRKMPNIRAGDTVCVSLKVSDNNTTRIQKFEGTCIAIRNKSIGSNIVIQKESGNIKVTRTIMIYAPHVAGIELIKIAKKHKRAKLYYLDTKRGKQARISSNIVSASQE